MHAALGRCVRTVRRVVWGAASTGRLHDEALMTIVN